VAFEPEASRVVDPDSVAPFEGMMTLVVGGLLTVIPTPELNALPPELKASDKRAYEPLGTVVVFQLHNHPYWVGVAVQSTGPE
jgi:hypothetical protein